MMFFRILGESFQFALHALKVNRLRTVLSLLGITIGIFTIISVFTLVDSLERSIRNSISNLGSEVIYVQVWPWGASEGEYAWWKYFQRPQPNYREFQALEKRMTTAESVCFAFAANRTVKYATNSIDNTTLLAVTHEYYNIWSYDLDAGRYFSPAESTSGVPVAVLGAEVAEGLFGDQDPIDQKIKLMGRKVRVIGVFERQGESLVGQNIDEFAILPMNFVRGIMSDNNQQGAFIMAMAAPGIEVAEMKDELQGAMRSIRKLQPKADDNFALNEISVLTAGMDALFSVIGGAGLIIGLFSILVGGFGIANIMFVSVKERTHQIGIQKSLGAKNYFILAQFLSESVVLSVIGGAIGLLLVYLAVLGLDVFKVIEGFEIKMSIKNIMLGVVWSAVIGIVSGFIPAWMASRLNPVDALRAGK